MIADARTKILLLDDDPAFVEVTARYFESKLGTSVVISRFTHSEKLLEHIFSSCYLPESPQDILNSFYSNKINPKNIEQTLKDLSELPALIVIDHQLQNETVTGVDVTKKIKEYIPCPFVALLTSQLNTDNAVELHNNDIIDLFVQKDGVHSLDYIVSHITKQIEKYHEQYNLNVEDIFEFDTVLEEKVYISKRKELLDEMYYKSYLTISNTGDIALLDCNNQVKTYCYQNKAFSLNG